MKVIGFYTKGTSYEADAHLLAASLERVGMEYDLTAVRDKGDWYANTSRKARFLRAQREAITGPLLYIDADAFVHEDCTRYFRRLGYEGVDFAAHFFHGPSGGYDRSKVKPVGWWMLSGTLFLGDTPGCRKLLNAWVGLNDFCTRHEIREGHGQKNLWYLTTCMKDLKVHRLPGRYCYVFDKPWCYPPGESRVIEHTIGSRENRAESEGKVNGARRERIRELYEIVGWELVEALEES